MRRAISFLLNRLFTVRPGFDSSAVGSIVVFQFGHIGDVVLSFPFLKALRQVFYQARITFVCGGWGGEIVKTNTSVDEVIIFNHPWQDRKRKGVLTAARLTLGFLGTLRKENFDLAIDLKGNLNTALINLFSGARFKAGRDQGGHHYPYVFSSPDYSHYEALNLLSLLGKNRSVEFPGYGLVVPDKASRAVGSKLSTAQVGPFVVVHPTTPWKPRNWGMNNYKALIKAILADSDLAVIIIGGKEEAEVNKELAFSDPKRVNDFSGKLDLMETAALISKAEVFIGSDSGPAHMAAAVGTRVLALLGPAEYPRFAPFNPKADVRIVRHEVCPYQSNNNCRQVLRNKNCVMKHNLCMQAITPDEVYAGLRRLLAAR